MRLRMDASSRALNAGSDSVRVVEEESQLPADRATSSLGRAYRAGRLICGCVHVTVLSDGRLGLAPRERRVVRVRFHEPLDDELRAELTRLVRRRGAAARRVVERASPIEVVVHKPYGERERIVGLLEPPQVRHGHLRAIEFELRRSS